MNFAFAKRHCHAGAGFGLLDQVKGNCNATTYTIHNLLHHLHNVCIQISGNNFVEESCVGLMVSCPHTGIIQKKGQTIFKKKKKPWQRLFCLYLVHS